MRNLKQILFVLLPKNKKLKKKKKHYWALKSENMRGVHYTAFHSDDLAREGQWGGSLFGQAEQATEEKKVSK